MFDIFDKPIETLAMLNFGLINNTMKKIFYFIILIIVVMNSCKRLDPPINNNDSSFNGLDTLYRIDSILTDIDGNHYTTISYYINDSIYYQTWMQQNLTVSHYQNGDGIPEVSDSATWANLTTGAWCWYNNDSATFAATYGKLYNWYAVNDPRGLAPAGWDVPEKSSYDSLVKFIDVSTDTTQGSFNYGYYAGGPMKQTGTILWRNPNRRATNSSGFSGLPGGCRTEDAIFNNNRVYGVWWTKTSYSNDFAWFIFLGYDYQQVGRSNDFKKMGFSVRCIRR